MLHGLFVPRISKVFQPNGKLGVKCFMPLSSAKWHKTFYTIKHFNGFQPLTIITKSSMLDVTAVLDPPLDTLIKIHLCRFPWECFEIFIQFF